jgi:biopolymer transport protein ExbD
MKFPRQAKIFRGQLDVAPFAAVLFLLIFFLLAGSMLYTPGLTIQVSPPMADGFAGTDNPTIMMAVTGHGQFLLDNQVVDETDLKATFQRKVHENGNAKGLTLVLIPDKTVTYDTLVKVRTMARDAGVSEVLEGVGPNAYSMKGK